MGDNIQYFQEFNLAFALSKTFSKFIFEILFRSDEKIIPKSVNSFILQCIVMVSHLGPPPENKLGQGAIPA